MRLEIGGSTAAAQRRQQTSGEIVGTGKARLNCSFERVLQIRTRYARMLTSRAMRQAAQTTSGDVSIEQMA